MSAKHSPPFLGIGLSADSRIGEIPSGMADTDMSESCELMVYEDPTHSAKQSAASLLQVNYVTFSLATRLRVRHPETRRDG